MMNGEVSMRRGTGGVGTWISREYVVQRNRNRRSDTSCKWREGNVERKSARTEQQRSTLPVTKAWTRTTAASFMGKGAHDNT